MIFPSPAKRKSRLAKQSIVASRLQMKIMIVYDAKKHFLKSL